MSLDLCLNIDGIKESLDTAFNSIVNEINNANDLSQVVPEVKEYFEKVSKLVTEFFYTDNAGGCIKKLFTVGLVKQVHYKDFEFGLDQYKKYLEGMKDYLEKSKSEVPTEMVDSFNQIIEKDENFIKMLFLDSTGSNPERPGSLLEALNEFKILAYLKDLSDEFSDKISKDASSPNKLMVLSTVRCVYYIFRGMMNMLMKIVEDEKPESNPATTAPVYAVF